RGRTPGVRSSGRGGHRGGPAPSWRCDTSCCVVHAAQLPWAAGRRIGLRRRRHFILATRPSETRMRKTLLLVPVIAAIALAGCSWGIKLTDAGRQVRTDWNGDMSGCRQLGKVTVSVADHLGPIDRNAVKVRDEREMTAPNEALDLQGAHTVQPLAEPTDSSQPWTMYQCSDASTRPPSAGTTTAPAATKTGGVKTYPFDSGSH